MKPACWPGAAYVDLNPIPCGRSPENPREPRVHRGEDRIDDLGEREDPTADQATTLGSGVAVGRKERLR